MSATRAVQTAAPAAPPAEVVSAKEVILRNASNPAIDPERLERYLAMYERLAATDAERAFNGAMNEAQTELRAIGKDATSDKGKYASFVALDRVARPIYSAHGFSLSFDTGDGAPPDHIRLLCYVSHRDGHTRTYKVDMPADGKGARGGDVMTKTHATGAAMTYGQRYLLRLIFNLAVGEDNDAGADGGRAASDEERGYIEDINEAPDTGALAAWKANYGNAARKYPAVIALYNKRVAALKPKKAPAQ